MTDFLDWHPSSHNAQKLYEKRNAIIKQILLNPRIAFEKLEGEWNFGKISELWDDFIFDNIVRPALDQILNSNLVNSINEYSAINHLLFQSYIRREENPTRFRRAFWNVNSYGLRISSNIKSTILNQDSDTSLACNENSGILKIAFVLKGPYKLAHTEFLQNFLVGAKLFCSKVQVHLILIDEASINTSDLGHIFIHSFYQSTKTSQKVNEYIKLCREEKFDNICWVACVQDLTLYMGMQLAPVQSYWSMKYHSIIMPTIQKYAGLGFGGNSFEFDDVQWFRGRAFPDLLMPKIDKDARRALRKKHNIPDDVCLIGCFVRSEKLYDPHFQEAVKKLLEYNNFVHFVVASQSLPKSFSDYIKSQHHSISSRFHYLGWINTKKWVSNLDIYFDSSPRGSCNTIFEAIEMSIPVIMSDTSYNRESSALPYLISAARSLGFKDHRSLGLFTNEDTRIKYAKKLIDSIQSRKDLAMKQSHMLNSLKGQSHLFAKDYLNYFLSTDMKIKDLHS